MAVIDAGSCSGVIALLPLFGYKRSSPASISQDMTLGKTSPFLLLTLAATMLVFVCVLWNASISRAQAMARGFYVLSVVLSLATLIYILLGDTGVVRESDEFFRWLRPLLFRGWLVIGVGISSALLVLLNMEASLKGPAGSPAVRAFITAPAVLDGLCFSVSLSFLCTEVGKLAHLADMRQFFVLSGYAAWFLYFIMVAESLGAFSLLISRTMVPAAIGLMAIMVGAILTHAHKGDPFSDSLQALHLLVLLACILVVRLLRTRVAVAQPSESARGTS
jgi:DoxX-like family